MRRWATETNFVTYDQDRLQRIEIYAEEKKEEVKREHKGYNYTLLLLVPEKEQTYSLYKIAKISRI